MEETMRNRLEAVKKRFAEIEEELSSPDIASDIKRLTDLSKERASLEKTNEEYAAYVKLESDLKDIDENTDPELAELMKEERKKIVLRLEEMEKNFETELIPQDPNDKKNIIVEIRGAVGGDEANLFAGDLERMYVRYAESQGWKVKYIDSEEGAAGGYSYVSFMIKGENVYSKLKFESGAHRVQHPGQRRIPHPPGAGADPAAAGRTGRQGGLNHGDQTATQRPGGDGVGGTRHHPAGLFARPGLHQRQMRVRDLQLRAVHGAAGRKARPVLLGAGRPGGRDLPAGDPVGAVAPRLRAGEPGVRGDRGDKILFRKY